MAEPDTPRVRRWKRADIPALVAVHEAAYPDFAIHYGARLFDFQFEAFPEGQLLIEVDGKIAGYATSLIVQLADDLHRYTYEEITGSGTFGTHDPSGDTLYGADIAVLPKYRGHGLAAKLYRRRKNLVSRYNLRRMLAYGRIPGYAAHAAPLTAEEYVEEVVAGRLSDSALNAHLKAGYRVKRVLLDFVPDASSLNYATLLEWENPRYDAKKRTIAASPLNRPVRRVRVCAAQYLMRRIDSWDEFKQTVEFFVDTADAYHCHFLLLPEYFTAQLIYTMGDQVDFDEAVKNLTGYHERYVEMFIEFATRYQLYIIGGTIPTRRNGKLYNTAHLFSPQGEVFYQDKLHVTPGERSDWHVQPGERLVIFETPLAKIGILVCYDIEFPELTRLLAMAGVEIVFIPFSTDELKAFNRVRICAHARAVENYMYTVTAGNVGNLPTIKNYLLNYAQSAIYTPSDFAFPPGAIAGQADPNTETVVIGELDLTTLGQQREEGTVRPFFDRRADLYDLRMLHPIHVVRTE